MKSIRLVAVLGVASAAVTLVGCTSAGGSEPTAPENLTVWVMGDSSDHFDELVAPFEESSGIDVETVAVPWDAIDEKFTTAVASGNGPDLLQIGISKLRTFADSGSLMALDEATIADYPNLAASNFIDGVAGDATAIGGEIVSVPWVSDTRVLFYRTDILAETRYRRAARNLGRAACRRGGARRSRRRPVRLLHPAVGQCAARRDDLGPGRRHRRPTTAMIDFDTPEFKEAVDLYTGLYADGSVPTNSDFDQTQGFISGIAPMLISGPVPCGGDLGCRSGARRQVGCHDGARRPRESTSLLAGSNLGVWGATEQQGGRARVARFPLRLRRRRSPGTGSTDSCPL